MSKFPPLSCDLTVPFVIDLDGTLVPTDTLHEALFLLFRRDWSQAWRVPLWIFQGRAVVKEKLGAFVTDQDVANFPINADLLEFAEREAGRGRKVVLATAADRRLAEKVAQRFPFISQVMASDGRTNFRGRAKADALSEISTQKASSTQATLIPTWRSGAARPAPSLPAAPNVYSKGLTKRRNS